MFWENGGKEKKCDGPNAKERNKRGKVNMRYY
jgi:hypothetical protein